MRFWLNNGDPVEISSVAERPKLARAQVDAGAWPEFMRHNRVAQVYFWRSLEVFPETCLVATNTAGTVIADAHAVRFASTREGRDRMPDGGWEQVVVWAFADAEQGITPDTLRTQHQRRDGRTRPQAGTPDAQLAAHGRCSTRPAHPRRPRASDLESTRTPHSHGRVRPPGPR